LSAEEVADKIIAQFEGTSYFSKNDFGKQELARLDITKYIVIYPEI